MEQIRGFVGADTLEFLSLEGMLRAAGKGAGEVCTACWNDDQPVKLPRADSSQMGLFEKTVR